MYAILDTTNFTVRPRQRTERHPALLGGLLALGLPLGLVLCVTAGAYAILLPVSYVLGWL